MIRKLRRKKTDSQKQTLTYFIILVLLIIFFATVGFQFVINTSLYIAGFSKNTIERPKENDDILLEPEIYDIPDATNSARINISGYEAEGSTIEIYVNNKVQDEIKLEKDEFTSRVRLKAGTNTIFARAESKNTSQTKDSDTYKVVYLSQAPSIDIESPSDNDIVNNSEITVRGVVNGDASVKVNNAPTVVDSEGKFSSSVRLKEGDNTIHITATDIAGNTETKEIKVKYEKDE